MALSLPTAIPAENPLILTTGLGLSDQGIPLRLPALLSPGLNLLGDLLKEGRQARYIVYQATNFIIETNKLNAPTAKSNAKRMARYLRCFVDAFYPQSAPFVDIKIGSRCPVRKAPLKQVEELLQNLAPEARPSETSAQEPINKALTLIRDYGSRHGGGKLFFRYAAANVLLNGGLASTHPLLDSKEGQKAAIVPLGGKKEEPFFALTSAIAAKTSDTPSVFPLIVPTGKMPTYYPCPDGDLLLDAPNHAFVPPRRIKKDFAALHAIGASIPLLQELSRPKAKRKMTLLRQARP